MVNMLLWDIYELSSAEYGLRGVRMRGRLRKFAIINSINLLVENTEGGDTIRFAVLADADIAQIRDFLAKLVPDIFIEKKLESVKNPVLSKIKINFEDRYCLEH